MRDDTFRWRISTSRRVTIRIFVLARTSLNIQTFQTFDLENLGHVHIRSDAIRWRTPTSIKFIARSFMHAITVSKMLMFEMFDLDNWSTTFETVQFDDKYRPR